MWVLTETMHPASRDFDEGMRTVANFKFDSKGLADLQKHMEQQLKKAELEANRAAARESTPEAKARAFARVLRKYGVENVNEAELRKKFSR